jgi:glycosyltransferase involved in cell wall biosynthesis
MFNVARHLERAGLGVAVLTGYEAAQVYDGPPVVVAPIGPNDWSIVGDKVRRYDPDVIVTHHIYARWFADQLAATGRPIVQLVLNGERLPCADHAVYISDHVRRRDPTARPSDVTITPPAFADVVADTHGDAIGFIKPLPHKGVELVAALAYRMRDKRFVVLRGEWQTLENVTRLRRRQNVTLMEPVADIRDFWRLVRLVLIPSVSEDAGTVAQEATLNRVPAIASNVDGLAETAAGGVLLDPYDIAGWEATIRALDDQVAYQRVVDRQLVHLAAYDHVGRLDRLAAHIEWLAY